MTVQSRAIAWLAMGAGVLLFAGCEVRQEQAEGPPATQRTESGLRRAIDPSRELVITDFSVIESPLETAFSPQHPAGTEPPGAWSFGRLIHNLLPPGERGSAAASRLVLRWLGQWETDQRPNPLVTASSRRPRVRTLLIDPWKQVSGCTGPDEACTLDFTRAPFRLIAIVYRPDLRELGTDTRRGIGGEGRFVFQMLDAAGQPLKGTVIFEYSLPIHTNQDTLTWARKWHQLGSLPFGEAYNAHLRALTNGFAGPDADRSRPNGNALNQLRTNELALKHAAGCHPSGDRLANGLCVPAESTSAPTQKLWELREFLLTPEGLVQAPVAQEPSRDFDVVARLDGTLVSGSGGRSNELARWLLDHADAIRANTHRVPREWLANASVVGSGVPAWGTQGTGSTSLRRFTHRSPEGVLSEVPEDVRAAFALSTCAGCHRHESPPATGAPPTQTFLHLTDPRALDPAEANDQIFLVPPGASPEQRRATHLSPFLLAEIAPGGPRYSDFENLLGLQPWELRPFRGLRACAGPRD